VYLCVQFVEVQYLLLNLHRMNVCLLNPAQHTINLVITIIIFSFHITVTSMDPLVPGDRRLLYQAQRYNRLYQNIVQKQLELVQTLIAENERLHEDVRQATRLPTMKSDAAQHVLRSIHPAVFSWMCKKRITAYLWFPWNHFVDTSTKTRPVVPVHPSKFDDVPDLPTSTRSEVYSQRNLLDMLATEYVNRLDALPSSQFTPLERDALRQCLRNVYMEFIFDSLAPKYQDLVAKHYELRRETVRPDSDPRLTELEQQVRSAYCELAELQRMDLEALQARYGEIDTHLPLDCWKKVCIPGRHWLESKFWYIGQEAPPQFSQRSWSRVENNRLLTIVEAHPVEAATGCRNWQQISEELGTGRRALDCLRQFKIKETQAESKR
jgi:hypothetical protein